MFNRKQTTLGSKKQTSDSSTTQSTMTVPTNPFLKEGLRQSATTTSLGNGAVKLTTTGSDFVDQFGKITNYKKPRSYQEIDTDMKTIWGQNPFLTMCLVFYIRMITRVVSLFDGTKTTTTQTGQGLKHEGIFRMIWVAVNYPDTFWKNITLFISIGSWKDVITMLSYDLQWNGWERRVLDWNKFGQLILAGLENPNNNQLLLKYLPQIKSNSQCKTLEAQADNITAKWICSLLFGEKDVNGSTYKQYRKLKSSGTAHTWQQLISQKRILEIDFNTIHGRALSKLVSGKFLQNQGLEEAYNTWIEKKPIAKYTGFVYELMAPLGLTNRMSHSHLKAYQVKTMNAQFMQLVDTAKKNLAGTNGFIGVLDSSGSMWSPTPGTKASAYSIGKTLTLFMSYLLEGRFADCFLEFSDSTIMKQWKGDSPVEKLCNETSSIVAGTNFLSIAEHFGKILKQGVAESEFPTGIVCFSDGCFNSTGSNKSNFRTLLDRLKIQGFSADYINNFKVVLWDIPNGYYGKPQTAFEDFADTPNLFHVSGLDGSALTFLLGTKNNPTAPKTSDELFLSLMDQEIMSMIEI